MNAVSFEDVYVYHIQGHATAPRTTTVTVVRTLAWRAVMNIVDESRMSKTCPSGLGGDMGDVVGGETCVVVVERLSVVSQALEPPARSLQTGRCSRLTETLPQQPTFDG